MGEFRIGRKSAQHSYPESRFAGLLGPFARNFAAGPLLPDVVVVGDGITGGTPILWDIIESGAPASISVPITPKSTGIIRITGVVAVKNSSGAAVNVLVQVALNGVRQVVPFSEEVTVVNHAPDAFNIGGAATLPIVAELAGLVVGVTRLVSIVVTAETAVAINLLAATCTLDIQEVAAATG
jgi:hypothetical protein